MEDWLEGNPDEKREQLKIKAIEFAKNYTIFETDERGRELLEHWKKTLLLKRTPVDASHAEYAADEAVRGFIGGILKQLELAKERD